MIFWNREQATGMDCVWDFVDNVSPSAVLFQIHQKRFSFFKQGRNNHVRGLLTHWRSRLGTLWIFTSTDLGVESLTPLFYGLS